MVVLDCGRPVSSFLKALEEYGGLNCGPKLSIWRL